MEFLNDLKNFNVRRMDMDDMLVFAGALENTRAQYEKYKVPVPEYLSNGIDEIGREIKARLRDKLRADLARAEARFETLKSPDIKRTETAAEIERLKAEIAG